MNDENSNDNNFTFDLEEMKFAMESKKIKVPISALVTDEAFEEWINTVTEE